MRQLDGDILARAGIGERLAAGTAERATDWTEKQEGSVEQGHPRGALNHGTGYDIGSPPSRHWRAPCHIIPQGGQENADALGCERRLLRVSMSRPKPSPATKP